MDININKKIICKTNEYNIIKKIGSGFSGKVYEAQNIITHKIVAIKIIDKNYITQLMSQDNNTIDCNFKNEVNIMKYLNCQYSCKYIDSCDDEINYYLIMKRYACDLNLLLKEKFPNGIPIHILKKCLNQLNEVFKKMDEDKIVHRDIKPENILIEYINNYNFNFILSDFSFGKYMNDNSKLSTLCGTQPYMTPEIITNESNKTQYNSNVDIWSLGVTILKMLNKLNFNLYREIIPDLNDKLLEDLLSKMIKIEPNQRINWNEYFQHDFFKKKIKKIYKNGDWEEYPLVDNIRKGKGIYHYNNGKKVKTHYYYDEYNKNTMFVINDKLYKFQIINDKKEGDAICYLSNGDKINFKYENDIKQGEATKILKNGDKIEFRYENDIKNGKATNFLKNSKIEFKYINGIIEGKATEIFNDGRKIEFEYNKGDRHGKAVKYFPNEGKIEFLYNRNKKEGKAIEHFKNGRRIEFTYSNDKKQGKAMYYFTNGDKINMKYINDRVFGKAILFLEKNGKIELKYFNNRANGEAIHYLLNGDYINFSYKNGIKEGKATEFKSNGNKIEFYFINGIREGTATEYLANKDKIEFQYKNNKREGKGIYYFSNGTQKNIFYEDDKEDQKAKNENDNKTNEEEENNDDVYIKQGNRKVLNYYKPKNINYNNPDNMFRLSKNKNTQFN